MPPAFAARVRGRILDFLEQHTRANEAAALVRDVVREQSKQRLGLSAAGIAFWFVIAIFPALLAVVMLLGLVLEPQQLTATINEIEKASPNSLGGVVLRQVEAAADQRPSTLSLGFAVSLVVVLWSTSAGYYNFARGTRMAYGIVPQSYVAARSRAFVGAFVGVILTALMAVASALVLSYAGSQSGAWRVTLILANVLIGLILLTFILALLFRFSTGSISPRPTYLPGAAFGGIGAVAVFTGFGFYVSFAGNYEAVYGALSSAIILMLSVYFAAYAVLIGAVINSVLGQRRR